MNRSKRPMNNQLRKKMSKEVRLAPSVKRVEQSRKDEDELTSKELLKKFPKKNPKKQAEKLKAIKRKIALKKKKPNKIPSKRTTPGEVPIDYSPPSYPHKEGTRWIKTLNTQTAAQRTIQTRKGTKKK